MWFFIVTTLISLLIRWYGELQGTVYWVPMVEVVKTCWGMLTGFALYALAFRHLRGAPETVRRRLIAICQLSLAGEGALSIIERVRNVGRATAHLDEPNKAGAYFASGAVLFLVFGLFEHTRRRWAYFAAFLFCLAGLFNSLSRGGMLAATVACAFVLAVFFTATRGRTGTKAAVIVLAVVLTANAGIFLPQRVIDRVAETFGGESKVGDEDVNIDGSSAERLIFWKAGWDLFLEWPLGYGATTFPEVQEARTGYGKASHNVFVLILVEQGALGILAMLVLVFAVLAYLWRAFSRSQDEEIKCLALALMGWWTAHVIAHVFINSFFFPQMTGQFWLLLACLGGALSTGTSPSVTRNRKIASAARA
jgi:O-antigen ligase